MFQELFATKKNGEKNILSNMYVATVITALGGFVLCLAGYSKVWPLFGAANQLVAVPAFLAIACYLKKIGKNNKMLFIPIIFMAAATLTSLCMTFVNNIKSIAVAEGAAKFTCVLQDVIIVPLVVLAIILLIDGAKALLAKKAA